MNRHGDTLDEKSLTICSGTDYININYQHIVCPDAATAKASNIILRKYSIGYQCQIPSSGVWKK